jgi:hypothetical protein
MLIPMHRTNRVYLQGLVFAAVTLFIFWSIEIGVRGETVALPLQHAHNFVLDANFLFSIALLTLLVVIFIKRRKIFRAAIGSILSFSSYVCWFSTASWWSEYNISPLEQRFIAVVLLSILLWVLISKSSKQKRRHFSEIVRRDTIQKQKGKCKRCKRRLEAYGVDADHKDNDRANNKASNCVLLCPPCHRRKHSQ